MQPKYSQIHVILITHITCLSDTSPQGNSGPHIYRQSTSSTHSLHPKESPPALHPPPAAQQLLPWSPLELSSWSDNSNNTRCQGKPRVLGDTTQCVITCQQSTVKVTLLKLWAGAHVVTFSQHEPVCFVWLVSTKTQERVGISHFANAHMGGWLGAQLTGTHKKK